MSSKFDICQIRHRGVTVVNRLIGLLMVLVFFGVNSESIAADSLIKGVDASALSNGQVELRIEFEGGAPENIGSFTIDNPARLSIDIPQSKLSVENGSFQLSWAWSILHVCCRQEIVVVS